MNLLLVLVALLCSPSQQTTVVDPAVSLTADNSVSIQTALDAPSLGNHIVRLPAGTFFVERPVNIPSHTALVGVGIGATVIKSRAPAEGGIFNGPVVGAGGAGRWPNSVGRLRVQTIAVKDLTVWQACDGDTNNKCLWVEDGDDIRVDRVRCRGSFYEGLVCGSWCHRVTSNDCEAWDCGNGGLFYGLSTAGCNVTSIDFLCNRWKSKGCGQGFELGNTRQRFVDCDAVEPGPGQPSIGFNVGSSVAGVYRISISRCVTRGYPAAFSCGNGIGRLAKIDVTGSTFYNGAVSFMGGKHDNAVPHADQGPDTEGSTFIGNTIIVADTGTANGGEFLYNTGPAVSGKIYGREPLRFERNTIICMVPVASTPLAGWAGEITAKCTCVGNQFIGLDASPGRGDFGAFSNNANPSVSGFPTFVQGDNVFIKKDGSLRQGVVKIETRP